MRRAALLLFAVACVTACGSCPRHPGRYGGADFGVCQADSDWIAAPSLPSDVRRGLLSLQCDFHQFSWQSFLYLMGGDESGRRPIDTWMSTRGIFVPPGQEPARWGDPPPPASCGDGLPVLRQAARTANSDDDPDGVLEAGSEEPLVDQNGRWVHFDVVVDRVQYDYLTGCDLYRDACFESVASDVAFPVGSIEVKRSWRIVETCDLPDSPHPCTPEDATRFFTMRAVVDPYRPPLTAPSCQPVTVALVGFHLVSRLPYRPAWIWSSFEHVDNVPLCDDAPGSPPPRGWTFYAEDCRGPDCETNAYRDPCGGDRFDPACTKPPIPTQVCRKAANGGGNPASRRRIRELDASVHEMISAQPDWQIFRNYELVGTLWKLEAYYYDMDATKLANSTMETYDQDTSCFGCHERGATRSSADFSHVFAARKPGSEACRAGLPAYCPVPEGR